MKKANVQVMYESKQNPNGLTVVQIKHLLINNTEFINSVVVCEGWRGLYDTVLRIIKNNNFYVKKWTEFGSMWYDIAWYDYVNDKWDVLPYPEYKVNAQAYRPTPGGDA